MNEELLKKFDILIKLTASNVIKEDKNQTQSILKLSLMGIGYRDIAKILGTSDNYVAMIISKNKTKKKSVGNSENDWVEKNDCEIIERDSYGIIRW